MHDGTLGFHLICSTAVERVRRRPGFHWRTSKRRFLWPERQQDVNQTWEIWAVSGPGHCCIITFQKVNVRLSKFHGNAMRRANLCYDKSSRLPRLSLEVGFQWVKKDETAAIVFFVNGYTHANYTRWGADGKDLSVSPEGGSCRLSLPTLISGAGK